MITKPKICFIVILTLLLSFSLSIASSSAKNPAQSLAVITERVSVSSGGTQGNEESWWSSISADGRYVAFESRSNNLVDGDTNEVDDIFVHDRATGETTRVSVANDGTQGNGASVRTSISADGYYITFDSSASNLVEGDTNGVDDIFVHDRLTGETTRISVASDGTQGNDWSNLPCISADGRYVAFGSVATELVGRDTNGINDVFVHDRVTGETIRVSVASDGTQGNGASSSPSISPDGNYVAFYSYSNNLVDGDTNGVEDVFVHDRVIGETTRISVASDGTQGNNESRSHSISADGLYVAFGSSASNLVEGDTNGVWDAFVHNRMTGETMRISIASNGTQGNDGSWVTSISEDGRYVVFDSWTSNLVVGDTNGDDDVFVHDRVTGETTRVSVANNGAQGNNGSGEGIISADGRYVTFASYASNLVPGDTNMVDDIFVHDQLTTGLSIRNYLPFATR